MTTHNPKFRGTPGPWRVDGHEHKNGVVEYTIVSISGDAVGCAPVAEVLRNNPRPMPEQRIEANARLLAAAPDLLAVLEIIVGIFEPNKLTPYRSARETVDLAKQIIGYVYGADERNRPTNESPSNNEIAHLRRLIRFVEATPEEGIRMMLDQLRGQVDRITASADRYKLKEQKKEYLTRAGAQLKHTQIAELEFLLQ